MSFSLYLENIELNRNDPDYQIEDFWYGFKNSIKNFYQSNGLIVKNIQIWSDKLNEYKKEKKYDMIEASIKDYIAAYALELMKYDKFDNCEHSSILLKNMKRWKVISDKFHFGDTNKNKIIYTLFEAFNSAKVKLDRNLFPILELFKNTVEIILNNYLELTLLSFEFNQAKILDCIERIVGKDYIFELIKTNFPNLCLTNRDKYTSYLKLYKKYELVRSVN